MKNIQIPPLEELPKFSKENWFENIQKSLKNQDLKELYLVREGLEIDPFPTDKQYHSKPLNRLKGDWIIAVETHSETSEALNREILYYLENGAEAIKINNEANINLSEAFNKVHTSFLHLEIEQDHDFENTNDFHLVSAESSDSLIQEIVDLMNDIIKLLKSGQVKPTKINIQTSVNEYMPVSISKLRAIRILWLNVLKSISLPLNPVFLSAKAFAESDNQNTALIELSTMALNAVLGTCDLLYLDGKNFDQNQRRLAINIQHMLKMESKLHLYDDPLAGSYAIEGLTRQICEKVWSQLSID